MSIVANRFVSALIPTKEWAREQPPQKHDSLRISSCARSSFVILHFLSINLKAKHYYAPAINNLNQTLKCVTIFQCFSLPLCTPLAIYNKFLTLNVEKYATCRGYMIIHCLYTNQSLHSFIEHRCRFIAARQQQKQTFHLVAVKKNHCSNISSNGHNR